MSAGAAPLRACDRHLSTRSLNRLDDHPDLNTANASLMRRANSNASHSSRISLLPLCCALRSACFAEIASTSVTAGLTRRLESSEHVPSASVYRKNYAMKRNAMHLLPAAMLTLAACGGADGSPTVPVGLSSESNTPTPLTVHKGGDLESGELSDQLSRAFNVSNGWGPVEKDQSNGDDQVSDGGTLKIAGVVFAKGLGVHSNSSLDFALAARCSSFNASVGVDDGERYRLATRGGGTVAFQVLVDGVVKFDSGLMRRGESAKRVSVDFSGAQQLRLVVADGGDGNAFDHANWASAQVACGADAPPPTGVAYKGVTAAMWSEIEARAREFGDPHNCRARIDAIPSTGLAITPANGNAINDALARSNTVVLRAGVYRISSAIELAGRRLVGAPGEQVTIDARDVREAVRMGRDSVLSNVNIVDAQNVGVLLSGNNTLHRVSVARTGRSVTNSTNGRAFTRTDDNAVNNCFVSTEARDSYNWLTWDGKSDDATNTGRGGNGDGYVISGSTLIDSHAYNNSDDGFDSWEAQSNYFYFSQAYGGGKNPNGFPGGGDGGDGNGFKLGRGANLMYIYKSKAYDNKQSGFDANGNTAHRSFVIMCSEAYGNGSGGSGQDWAQGLTGNTRSCPP